MTADNLRERLADVLGWSIGLHIQPATIDKVLAVFAEHLTSDATVERVARALADELPLAAFRVGTARDYADVMVAALAAALASEGEASDA